MLKTYITTAIPYVNGDPHVGHALDYLLADVLCRYFTLQGKEVRLQAGVDEHGSKVYKKSVEKGVSVQDFVDENAEKFQDFIQKLDVRYTDFVRTTGDEHKRRCQEIWKKLSPHIYRASYEGWYCEGCERFVTDKEFEETNGICPDHHKSYTKLSEENYYLRIADFKAQIRQKIENDEMKITPKSRKSEFLNLLEDMPDVSISRPRKHLTWGIEVPDDPDQVMYVWIDALCNYITVLGYPDQDISEWWPAQTQVVGKDILRFHAGIWPAILMGLGLPLPKNLLTHGHVTVNGEKMSKSIGNVVNPIDVLNKHGVDALRYFFLRHASTVDDVDFTWEKYESAYEELANDLGNLVQRLATLCHKAEMSKVEPLELPKDEQFAAYMEKYNFNLAMDKLWLDVQGLNRQIDAEKPWVLLKEDAEKAKAVLSDLVMGLLAVNRRLSIFIPETSSKIDEIFVARGTEKARIKAPETPLFPKVR